MSKKQSLPLPLAMVREFEAEFPRCWEYVDYMRAGQGTAYAAWNPLCFVPIAATNAIISDKYPRKANSGNIGTLYAALAAWRQYKEIYTFAPDLREVLLDQADDIKLPIDALMCMPYPAIYIDMPEDDKYQGMFVFFEQDYPDGGLELRISALGNTNPGDKMMISDYFVHLKEGAMLSDSIDEGLRLMRRNAAEIGADTAIVRGANMPLNERTLREIAEANYSEIKRLIQLVLYICADNAEIAENPVQKAITRKPPPGTKPKDVYREIRSWDVGIKFAKAIKEASGSASGSHTREGGERQSPRPHTRRGHWHHYWTGAKGDRKLILKWTAPTFVGAREDAIATINKIG